MINHKPVLGFDINNTIDNFTEALLGEYNQKYGDNLTYDSITDYNITKFIKNECCDFWEEFLNNSLMTKIQLQHGAKDVINYFRDYSEIRFITALYPKHCGFFFDFLCCNFDWVRTKHFVRAENKQEYNLDVLVDDYYENLIGGQYAKVIKTAPWNNHISTKRKGMLRIDRWDLDAIDAINCAMGYNRNT